MPSSRPSQQPEPQGYLHGFSDQEADRLVRQARILEHRIHGNLPFKNCRNLLEVGCGVGAQTQILLRDFPDLHVTGLDANKKNLDAATRVTNKQDVSAERVQFVSGDATAMDFDSDCFDGAYLCWVLEHIPDASRVLSEVRRVLIGGSPVVVNEVQNASFFLAPYSPSTLAYWAAFNDHQYDLGGDPFIGARLGNLLLENGYRDIDTEVRTVHLDNRWPEERSQFLAYWSELLLSGSEGLLRTGLVNGETVEGMKRELAMVAHDPDSVIFYSFVQATARVDLGA
ncbi:MAG: SAM-dependent methyltransferase [Planctomycetes bacterium]|jgi:ubiquinone/menaquinone biosynthesis C-methylase UbiE|nr:SAM-dependent methyltransferase [Planctomycetota bacterium]